MPQYQVSVYRTIGPLVLILSVVCTVGICEFCPFSFLFFRVSNLLLWAPSAAYNNLIDTLPFIMPPTLKKLMGHIAFGACVRGWVRAWVGVSHFLYLL